MSNLFYCLFSVAKTPRDLTILRDSNTSLYVGWNLPSTIPIGYVIYYWLDRADIQQVNVSNGTTQHYVLEGLETGANYSVSMLALSQHLPSATVGSPIISGILRNCSISCSVFSKTGIRQVIWQWLPNMLADSSQ